MGGALFRWEACETDAAVDTLTFLADDPHVPQFRFKHVSAGTVQDVFPSSFRFYSRYIFLHVFTALQMLLAILTLYLFNYLGTVRYYYASAVVFLHEDAGTSSLSQEVQVNFPHTREALAPLYLATIALGIFFVFCVAAYISVTNSEWCISSEMEKFAQEHRSCVQQEIMQDAYLPPGSRELLQTPHQHQKQRRRVESIGCRLRRLGVRWISFTRSYYAFPARYLPDFDYRHDIHVKYGAHATRRDPQCTLFLFMSPFVLFLVVVDIVTIDDMRVKGVQVTFLQGLLVVCGPLLLLYMARSLLTRGLMCGRTCCTELCSLHH